MLDAEELEDSEDLWLLVLVLVLVLLDALTDSERDSLTLVDTVGLELNDIGGDSVLDAEEDTEGLRLLVLVLVLLWLELPLPDVLTDPVVEAVMEWEALELALADGDRVEDREDDRDGVTVAVTEAVIDLDDVRDEVGVLDEEREVVLEKDWVGLALCVLQGVMAG